MGIVVAGAVAVVGWLVVQTTGVRGILGPGERAAVTLGAAGTIGPAAGRWGHGKVREAVDAIES